MSTSIVDLYST